MEYVSLKQYFHMNPEKAEKEYFRRFNSSEAIQIGIEINDKPAFFIMCSEVYSSVIRLMKADKDILNLTNDLPKSALHQFTIENLINEIVVTNEIEGINSTRREIGNVLAQLEQVDKKIRFKGLVNKYLMLNDDCHKPITSVKEIREIYDELVLDEIVESNPKDVPDGELFRKDSVSIYDSAGREIHTGVLSEKNIINTLEKAILFLNKDDIAVIPRIAAFHFVFGYIHPFYDGNGRTNRYISSRYVSNCYEPIIGYGLSFTIKKRLKEYYSAFKEAEHPLNMGDLTPFVISFCDMIAESAEQISCSLEQKRKLFFKYESAVQISFANKEVREKHLCDLASILVQAALFTELGISTKELVSFFNVSRQTIGSWIKKVSEVVEVEKIKEGKNVFYKANLTRLDSLSE